jgi:DNA polymerase-3 subunit epsilon
MHDLVAAAALLEASEDYKVLRRFVPRACYVDEPWLLGEKQHVRLALYLDCETTDLDREQCQILEFAAVQFSYDARTGVVYTITDEYQGFEEPTRVISPEAQAKHGITLDMVRGQRLDDARILTMAQDSHVIIAHNASFDRPIVERRFSVNDVFQVKSFACSYRDVPWEAAFGCENAKLSTVLAHTCGEFYKAHSALDDCRVGVHVLASAHRDDTGAMSYLLDNARQPIVRVWATGSPFNAKEALKARGYKWAGNVKTWYRDMREDDSDAEADWLLANAGVRCARMTAIDAKDKYSVRAEQ